MATREELHSTRGRTRLLFEMLRGDPMKVNGGWKSEPVKEALDLCLACKACKTECPMNVDMATYKAEFLAHYYEGRLRPRAAYAMGWIHRWAKLASVAPGLVNFFNQTPGISSVVKFFGGIAQQRQIPKFANQAFTDWFRKRVLQNQGKPQVILWPETLSNYFLSTIAKAVWEGLDLAGY